MLVITRKIDSGLLISSEDAIEEAIYIKYLGLNKANPTQIRLGIMAPAKFLIFRDELLKKHKNLGSYYEQLNEMLINPPQGANPNDK